MNLAIAQRIYGPLGGKAFNPVRYSFSDSNQPYSRFTEPAFDLTRMPIGVVMAFSGVGAMLLISTVQTMMLVLNALYFIFTAGSQAARHDLRATCQDISVGFRRGGMLVLAGGANFLASPVGVLIFIPWRTFKAIQFYSEQRSMVRKLNEIRTKTPNPTEENCQSPHEKQLPSAFNNSFGALRDFSTFLRDDLEHRPLVIIDAIKSKATPSELKELIETLKREGRLESEINRQEPVTGYTGLHYVAERGDKLTTLLLLKHGINTQIRSFANGDNPSVLAKDLVKDTEDGSFIALWIRFMGTSDIPPKDNIAQSPRALTRAKSSPVLTRQTPQQPSSAHAAVKSAHSLTNLDQFLRQHGASSINSYDDDGMTPLHIAAAKGDFFALDKCLREGADARKKTLSGQTALEFAKELPKEHAYRIIIITCLTNAMAGRMYPKPHAEREASPASHPRLVPYTPQRPTLTAIPSTPELQAPPAPNLKPESPQALTK